MVSKKFHTDAMKFAVVSLYICLACLYYDVSATCEVLRSFKAQIPTPTTDILPVRFCMHNVLI